MDATARQVAMYGCTSAEMKAGIDEAAAAYRNPNLALVSILSDVQEMIAHGDAEGARQYLNRVKRAIDSAAPLQLWAAE